MGGLGLIGALFAIYPGQILGDGISKAMGAGNNSLGGFYIAGAATILFVGIWILGWRFGEDFKLRKRMMFFGTFIFLGLVFFLTLVLQSPWSLIGWALLGLLLVGILLWLDTGKMYSIFWYFTRQDFQRKRNSKPKSFQEQAFGGCLAGSWGIYSFDCSNRFGWLKCLGNDLC